VAGDWDEVVTR